MTAERAAPPRRRLRAVVVDDEPLARARLCTLLAGDPEIEVAGEAADGREAVDLITERQPDLLFLDIQMPEMDGLAVLEEIGTETVPAVVFVTAYDQYALDAFRVHAVDYLLKPFDRNRFLASLTRAKATALRGADGELGERLLALLADLRPDRHFLERILVRSGGRVVFVKVGEIDWIEAEGNYLRLHCGGSSHLVRETMSGIEGRLDPAVFMRIHRSTIVSIDRIREFQPWFHGDYLVVLRDGTKLTLSRSYRHKLDGLTGTQA